MRQQFLRTTADILKAADDLRIAFVRYGTIAGETMTADLNTGISECRGPLRPVPVALGRSATNDTSAQNPQRLMPPWAPLVCKDERS